MHLKENGGAGAQLRGKGWVLDVEWLIWGSEGRFSACGGRLGSDFQRRKLPKAKLDPNSNLPLKKQLPNEEGGEKAPNS